LFQSIKHSSIQYTNLLFKEFESLNTNKDLNDFLAVQYDIKKEFSMGSPAPDFKLKSSIGKDVALSDYRGKVVYLSFWSSKCPMCQLDLPYARELEKELADKNVVFIYVSVDDEELWRYALKNRKLTGVQLFAENKDVLLQQYKVQTLPAYFLIDTDGTFIKTKAKRPSNDSVGAEIMQATGKK
jgi:peroxiredoxin